MGFFNPESKEQKYFKIIKDFQIHTTDLTVKNEIIKSKFVQNVGINSYEVIGELVLWCKNNDFNGVIGFKISPSGGMGGSQAIIAYGTAVKFI